MLPSRIAMNAPAPTRCVSCHYLPASAEVICSVCGNDTRDKIAVAQVRNPLPDTTMYWDTEEYRAFVAFADLAAPEKP